MMIFLLIYLIGGLLTTAIAVRIGFLEEENKRSVDQPPIAVLFLFWPFFAFFVTVYYMWEGAEQFLWWISLKFQKRKS